MKHVRSIPVALVLIVFILVIVLRRATTSEPKPTFSPAVTPSITVQDSVKPSEEKARPEERQVSHLPHLPPAQHLFRSLVTQYVKIATSPGHPAFTRFGEDERVRFRELRLLSLARPKEVEQLLLSTAMDSSKLGTERILAIQLLGELAASGRRESKEMLLQIAGGADGRVNEAALGFLYPVDLSGQHRDLYERRFLEGSDSAFHALSLWPDERFVKMAQALGMNPDSDEQDRSKYLLQRYDILRSGEWGQKVSSLIRTCEGQVEWWTPWALEVARAREMPSLLADLRTRLDANAEMALARLQRQGEAVRAETLAKQYPVGDGGQAIVDPCHDDILLAYMRLGGQLRPEEEQRLRRQGYLGNPEETLRSLLPER